MTTAIVHAVHVGPIVSFGRLDEDRVRFVLDPPVQSTVCAGPAA